MRTVWAVALITLKESLRHKVLYGILICALLVMISSLLISGLFMRDIIKVTLDLCLSAVSIGGLLVPFFFTINLLARDIENKTIYTLLAKTISRPTYICGRFLGLSLLTFLIMGILTCSTLLTAKGATFIYAQYFFEHLTYGPILVYAIIALLGIMVLNSVVFFWCSITTSSFLATLLTLSTYVIGQTVEDMVHFLSVKGPEVEISVIAQFAVKAALYIFPNLAAFDLKHQAAYSLNFNYQELFYLATYGICYITIMLLVSILVFKRRDLT
jgi:ABC-type transport system involved in multi-copper enzyme maturation permease subunit